ncbi:DUF5011 domain-containing protein [Candidatus Kaiserbacteria bacterium]|nr:DUF5011 domain-containing protein [Candidatus Kaiserbacteria bacterium]
MPRSAAASAVTLSEATSTSNNASTTLAKVGNTLSFQLNLSGTPSATSTPVINIFGMGTTSMSGSGAAWTYSTTSVSAWTTGNITFNMGWGGTAGEATTTFQSTASTTFTHVVFDKTLPTLSAVTMSSSNSSTTLAKVGDIITLTATSSEAISTATITIGGHAATFANVTASTTWKGTYTVQSGDTNGAQAFTADFSDYASNAGTQVTTLSSGAAVYIDTTGPVITITGNNPDSTYASNSTSYSDAGATATDAHDGTASVSASGSVNLLVSGTYSLTYTSTDTAGNSTTGTRTVTVNTPGNGAPIVASGGGGGSYVAPTPPWLMPSATTQTDTPSTSNTKSIESLQTQLNTLLAQISGLRGSTAPNANAYVNASANASFKRDLKVGSTGDDTKALQIYLNTHGFPITKSGAGSSGHETTRFGNMTKAALAKWQASVGITPATGYFGAKTRSYIASHQ